MVRVSPDTLLGVGLYSISDAALYSRVRPQMLSRWIYGDRQGGQVIAPQLDQYEGDRIVTFLDFVQALAIRRIRQERQISLQKLREAYTRATTEFSVRYPLALSNARIGLFGPPDNPSKQEIYICIKENEDEVQRYFQLTGKKHGNQLIGEVVITYSKHLEFNSEGLATRYVVYETKEGRFIMDPEIRFGEPFSEDTGYTAKTLYDAYQSEGSVAKAADVYGVPTTQVELAVDFFDYLRPPAAA